MRLLEVILKTVETCNINCSYCYFYVDTSVSERQITKFNKKIISIDVIEQLVLFLRNGVKKMKIDLMRIVFHGGEPLLQNKSDFDHMCSTLVNGLSEHVNLEFGIQTNGICIHYAWLELFSKYNISPGISLDGPAKYNDMQRIDFSGRGTHERVVKGIRKTQEFVNSGRIKRLSTISVIDARYSAKEVFDHFARELEIKGMSFLLPDYNYDTFPAHQEQTGLNIEDYGNFLCELFESWINYDDDSIDIVLFRQIVMLMMGGKTVLMADTGPVSSCDDGDSLPILTVYHDGRISPDDTYLTTDKNINSKNKTLSNSTFEEFTESDQVKILKEIRRNTPTACLNCSWLKICNGGASVNRYSSERGFDNPSIYCSALQMLYKHIENKLLIDGMISAPFSAEAPLSLETYEAT